ncbi:universal stress protein [Rothia sp. AR01]|uniref:Universal stress protein n=1 Tax=Rothia santali TaxID=2949643 RepID=A0A9X2HIH2_9MICC|nr:universal stress protein [Rothia santali]MCP3427112.1 universal stress protein [Rothia santali]
MRYAVGYAAHERGRDALNLGVALARATGAVLEVVVVVKAREQYSSAPRDDFGRLVEDQAKRWLNEAAELVPDDVEVELRLHRSINAPAGLMEVAASSGAAAVIVGGSSASGWLRHGVGGTGSALLHRSRIPVILAPRGYEPAPLTEIACAVSPEPESAGLVEEAVATLNRTGLPVRLIALAEGDDAARARESLEALVAASRVEPEDPGRLSVVVGSGASVADAVESVTWGEGTVLMAGSSRLARRGELFLSSTTAKILTRLPIPLVVVPREYHPGRGGSADQPWTGELPIVGAP